MSRSNSGDGQPILDVDHIQDLALKGADHTANMIALCPNCRAVKTRGANTTRWRSEFRRIAVRSHATAMKL